MSGAPRVPIASRAVGLALLAGAAVLVGIALWLALVRPTSAPLPPAAFSVAAEVGGPWSLVSHTGARLSERDFAGRFTLVYFGYTSCPDVCPVELAGVAAAVDALGPLADKVTPLFVSVDPARDTPEKLAPYVASFHPRLIGLSGSAEEVAAAARSFKVFYRKSGEGADYTMDHSNLIFFIGPDGKSRSIFRGGAAPAAMAQTMRAALERG